MADEPQSDSVGDSLPHDWRYEDDEYGSLADGGSYEVYRCTKCGRRSYVQLPD